MLYTSVEQLGQLVKLSFYFQNAESSEEPATNSSNWDITN